MLAQQALFGVGPPRIDSSFRSIRHLRLGEGAWVEHQPRWLSGGAAVFEHLHETTQWQAHQRPMYDRVVDVPRLTASLPVHGPGHPVLDEAARCLSDRYELHLDRISVAWYRDGNDSVAPHGDKMGPLVFDTVIAIVSLGGPRRFLIKPRSASRSLVFVLDCGDLLVMGGTAQHTCQHGVPKVAHANPRIAVVFRPALPHDDASADDNARSPPDNA